MTRSICSQAARQPCDFCGSTDLQLCYAPVDSCRDARVFVCEFCGLVQSRWSEEYKNKPRIATISSGADWGNIRHGKGLRLADSLRFIEAHLADPTDIATVLDIGSNRGHFMKASPYVFPAASEVIGIEPDSQVIDWCRTDHRQRVINGRFENISLKEGHFSFVFSSHTLEHAGSAREMLDRTHACLGHHGLHFLEVPSIENIKDSDIVEEFFIDKHSFHFDRSLLVAFLEQIGFVVVAGKNSQDRHNITLLLRKTGRDSPCHVRRLASPARVLEHKLMISDYKKRLAANRSLLRGVVVEIEKLSRGSKLALWGGGRIFDALVRFGGLDTRKVLYAIDQFIGPYLPRFHGLQIVLPQALATNRPDCVVVLARSSAEPIVAALDATGIRNVVLFSEMLKGVRDSIGASTPTHGTRGHVP
jgi:hypothetical protein